MPNILKSYDIPIKTPKKNADQTNSGSFGSYFYKETPFLEYGKSKAADLSSSRQIRQALQGGVCQAESVRLVSRAMAIFFFVSHGQTFRLSALFDIKKGKRLARPT